ncbi:hypothetical protein RIU14_11050 [Riemerella anatipestifer]|nr:hypothetical protein [Riemerella anatipestifer]MDR7695292.1 hypothetical protein [Riemerella anatipestifer]MDR7795487.1 hypothetical protein [Riemerella anatipestifer]
MEKNLITSNNEQEKSKKRQRLSLEEWIALMKLAFSNAKLPEINSQLAALGYTETKLDELLSQVSALEALHQKQKRNTPSNTKKPVNWTKNAKPSTSNTKRIWHCVACCSKKR